MDVRSARRSPVRSFTAISSSGRGHAGRVVRFATHSTRHHIRNVEYVARKQTQVATLQDLHGLPANHANQEEDDCHDEEDV